MSTRQPLPMAHPVLDPRPDATTMRQVLAGLPTGVALVAAEVEGRVVGMAVGSLLSVSLDPPLVSVAFDRASTTWPLLRRARAWGVSVLGEQHADLLDALRRPAAVRFDGIDVATDAQRAVVLPGALATLTVTPESEVEAGDHVLALLRVRELRRDADQSPLVFFGSAVRRLAA